MNINLMPLVISQDKVTVSRIITWHIRIPSRFEQGAKLRHIGVRYGDIQIGMSSGLLPEQGVDPPPAIDADIYVVLTEKLHDLDHILRGHFRNVFAHRTLWVPCFHLGHRSHNIDESVSTQRPAASALVACRQPECRQVKVMPDFRR
jgi:hypothetical protein